MKVFISIIFLLIVSPTIFACTCTNTENLSDAEFSKILKQEKAIFYGEVISLGEQRFVEENFGDNTRFITRYQAINFKVLRSWKGINSNKITVETEATSSCKYIPAVGSKVMIYAYQNKTGLFINQCSTNREDERMKRKLGEGKVFAQTQNQQSQQTENNEGFFAGIWKRIFSLFS